MDATTSRRPGRPRIGEAVNIRLGDSLLEQVDALAERIGTTRVELVRHAVSRLVGQTLALYRLEGEVEIVHAYDDGSVGVEGLGYHDADGGPWADDLGELLARHGWAPTEAWQSVGDTSLAPVDTAARYAAHAVTLDGYGDLEVVVHEEDGHGGQVGAVLARLPLGPDEDAGTLTDGLQGLGWEVRGSWTPTDYGHTAIVRPRATP